LGVAFYRGADCCSLVYDITNQKSFESISSWRDEFLHHAQPKDPENFPFVLLGNKVDRESDRKVSNTKASQWCKQNGNIPFYETSAKENTNVDGAFLEIAKKAIKQDQNEKIFIPTSLGQKLGQTDNRAEKKGCEC